MISPDKSSHSQKVERSNESNLPEKKSYTDQRINADSIQLKKPLSFL